MPKLNKVPKRAESVTVPNPPPYVTPGTVAKLLGFTRRGVLKLMARGALPAKKIGGRWLMHHDDFEELKKRPEHREPQAA